jgi:hypothetical protein
MMLAARREDSTPAVIWIPVPLPITGSVDTSVIQLIDRALARGAPPAPAATRPLLILEFRGAGNSSGPERRATSTRR